VSQNKNSKDLDASAIENNRTGNQHDSLNSSNFPLKLNNINWIYETPKINKDYQAQIRYHGELLSCRVEQEGPLESRMAKIIFKKPILVASGQSIVIYDKNICIGGGVV